LWQPQSNAIGVRLIEHNNQLEFSQFFAAFRFAHVDGLTGGTVVRLRSEAIERYRVDYVAGFSAAGFSYFVTNQRETFELTNSGLLPTVSGDLSSRIVQVSTRATVPTVVK